MSAVETYFIAWKGRRDGPYSLEQLGDLLERGQIGLLHRVETSVGLVPLRELLLANDPDRWSKVSIPANAPAPLSAGAPPGLLGAIQPRTVEGTVRNAAPAPGLAPAPVPQPEAIEHLAEDEAKRVYTVCGLCFLMPPLAIWSWLIARDLAGRGFPETARHLKWISSGLAASGLLLWGLLWWAW